MAEMSMMEKLKASAAAKALRGAVMSKPAGQSASTAQTVSGSSRDAYNEAAANGDTTDSYADWLKKQRVP